VHGITDQTYHRWKAKYGGMELSELQRLKQVEDENRRLKRIVAEQTLDIEALKVVVAKKWYSLSLGVRRWWLHRSTRPPGWRWPRSTSAPAL
jgi:hypothetical protein